MNIQAELIVFAEIGAAIAGFLSIFVGYSTREQPLDDAEKVEVLTVVSSGFSTVFIALIPLVIFRLHFEPVEVWTHSGIGALLITVPQAFYFGFLARWAKIKTGPSSATSRTGLIAGLMGVPVLCCFLLVALGVFPGKAEGLYLLALTFGLGSGTASFAVVVFRRFGV